MTKKVLGHQKSYSRRKIKTHQKRWQIQEAKAKFSELIERVTEEGAQEITKHGEPIAIIMSKSDYDALIQPKDSLIDFFKRSPFPEAELDLERIKEYPREVEL